MRDSNGTVHPGRVGIWAGTGSAAVKGDNFKVRSLSADLALDRALDWRFADDIGPCSISSGAYVMQSDQPVERGRYDPTARQTSASSGRFQAVYSSTRA